MAQADVRASSGIAPTPTVDAPFNPNWLSDPNQIALNLGKGGYTPAYNSNDKGSYERNYNSLINNLSPDQLLQRYSNANVTQFGTGLDQQNYQAYNSFKSLLGRAPTAQELAQALPAFQGGATTGNAWLANYAQQQGQNPANLAAGSGKYTDQINQVFQSQLGRNATSDEVTHFGSLMGTGNLDAYGLQQFVTGTPEYQGQQNTQFQTQLGNQLQNSDLQFFDQAKQSVMSQFAQNGTGNSSALDSALTQLMGQIQSQRSNYMASLSAQQYGNNQNLALSNYNDTMNQFLNNQQQNRQQSLSQQNQLMGRANDLTDYNTQMTNYLNYAGNNQPKTSNPLYGAIGTLGGAAIGGAATGSPTGATLGANLGGTAGNSYGYLNQRSA